MLNRRSFLAGSSTFLATSALASESQKSSLAPSIPMGKVDHCIYIWLGGGMGQTDTLDPKRLGDPKRRSLVPTIREFPRRFVGCRFVNTFPRLRISWIA